jgi:hypothetical protein
MEFFPPGALDNNPNIHALRDRWYVSQLLAMKELPLFPPAVDHALVYRLLFLPTFRQPSLVRLTETSGGWRAVCKRSDGRGGYSPGQLAGEMERELSQAEAKRFGRLLDRVTFWKMPSFVECAGLDGSQAVLEGMRAGGYHVVDRWSPMGTPYAELVEFLLGLCRGMGDAPPEPLKYLSSFAELEERLRSDPAEGS